MKLLLDTHVALWSVVADPALPARLHAPLMAEDAELYISAASVWEVRVKRTIGKLPVPADVFDRAMDAGCIPLAVTWAHARAAEALPFHHHDPFDWLLIAQVRVEGVVLATGDRAFHLYDVPLL